MTCLNKDYLKTLSYKDLQLSDLRNQLVEISKKHKNFEDCFGNLSIQQQCKYYKDRRFTPGLLFDRQTGIRINPYSDSLRNIKKQVANVENEIQIREENRNQIAKKENDNIKNYVFYFTIILIIVFSFIDYLKKENI